MAQGSAEPLTPRRILLFGGQGSQALFSPGSAKIIDDITKSSVAAAILVSRCHVAFLEELSSLSSKEQEVCRIDPAHFKDSKDITSPPQQYHTHGVLQATTLCLFQLVHYLAEAESAQVPFPSISDSILEVSGFCSGMIPAAVVASAEDSEQFYDFALEAFRLSFWIGYRTRSYSGTTAGLESSEQPWSLVVSGLSKADVDARLDEFYSKVRKRIPQERNCVSPNGMKAGVLREKQETRRLIRISAVSGLKNLSLSGPAADLSSFREKLGSPAITTHAYVHAWYHGGDELEAVVQDVIKDMQRQNIGFPTWSSLKRPIRSTVDGALFDGQNLQGADFAEWLVRHLLVHCVDWHQTSQNIAQRTSNIAKAQAGTKIHLISFGPSSEFLLAEIKSKVLPSEVEIMDVSSFKQMRKGPAPMSDQDAVAIVGMGIDLPGGKGPEQLWETLSEGLSVVREVVFFHIVLAKPYDLTARHRFQSLGST